MKSGKIINTKTGDTVATSIRVADKFLTRLRGLIGRDNRHQGGMWLVPCTSVHTIGMRFPIDLVYLDRHGMVRKIDTAVPPFRVCRATRYTHSILELPAGQAKRAQLRVGDRLRFRREDGVQAERTPS